MIIFWTLAIAIITAIACALCGVFLVVKREALVCEGLSHAVLPGIVLAFVLLRDRSSPLLIGGAAAMGLLMVLCVQALKRTRLVDGDASLGIVFAAMFSCGIILSKLNLRNTHFHAHCIIDGNLALAPLDALTVGGIELGPRAFFVMLGVLVMLIAYVAVFFKEFKLMLFDESLAKTFGFRPVLLHIGWLALVSATTVAAFETAGSILVVALIITPAAAAFLLTKRLHIMILISCLIGTVSAIGGFTLGMAVDISPTGPMSAVAGGLFLVALIASPSRGLFARWSRRRQQQRQLFQHLLLARLARFAKPVTEAEALCDFRGSRRQFHAIVKESELANWIHCSSAGIELTSRGRDELVMQEARFV